MGRSRIAIIFILFITLALGATAIFIGYRLSQKEEVTPDTTWAYPGQGACGAFIGYCTSASSCTVTRYNPTLITCNTSCCTFSAASSCAGYQLFGFWCNYDPGSGNPCLQNGPVNLGGGPGSTVCASNVGWICGSFPCWIQVDLDSGGAQQTTTYQTTTYRTTTYQTTVPRTTTYRTTTHQTTTYRTTTQGTTSQGTTTQGTTTQGTTTQGTTTNATTTNATSTNATTTQETTTNATTTAQSTSTSTLPDTGIVDTVHRSTAVAIVLIVSGIALYLTNTGDQLFILALQRFSPAKKYIKQRLEKRLLSKNDSHKNS